MSQYILPWQYWEISEILMDEFWYNYIRPKYQNNAKLCYMDTDRFIIHIKTESFMKILVMMLKIGLAHQTIVKMIKDHFQ